MIHIIFGQTYGTLTITSYPHNLAIKTNTCTKSLNQYSSLEACVVVIYYDFVIEKSIVGYILLIQLTTPPNKEKTQPLVELRLSKSPTQSASTKICMSNELTISSIP